jgi:hypothetical protein
MELAQHDVPDRWKAEEPSVAGGVTAEPGRKLVAWPASELNRLKRTYPSASVPAVMAALPGRKWGSTQKIASQLGLHRSCTTPPGTTLVTKGDIGFCAGMIIADGSLLETCVSSRKKERRTKEALRLR